ncbi:hypothetical protein F2Q70_00034831 [Brassica cretica]|uniref:Transcription elongation factor 1 homolog n=1 Tax=Brassica cretica TaxID=69181 RepID=A0A8S9JT43_BRACR|nr:hypothetical protein F2Q68_00029709 [Brassica cretica]KAF2585710.1 hypothetical protein F2Q70_00034831 [Brassica cretica]
MGKRKSRAKPATTKRMDKLDILICEESFSTTITAFSEAIDIYSEWIDECERVNAVEDDVEQEEEVEEEKEYEEEEEEEEVEERDDEDERVSVKRKFNYRDD